MTVYDAIVLRLSEKRGGNTLPAKAIKTTAKYLSENVGLEDAQEFSFLDLPSIVDEAWEKIESEKTPDFVRRKVARWVNNDPGEKMGGDATVMVSADEEVEDTETICGPSGGNPRGLSRQLRVSLSRIKSAKAKSIRRSKRTRRRRRRSTMVT